MTDTTVTPVLSVFEPKSNAHCRLWFELIAAKDFGISESRLIEATGLNKEGVLKALLPYIKSGVVTVRPQQVGTGGTCDHFYSLKVQAKIMVVPTPPAA